MNERIARLRRRIARESLKAATMRGSPNDIDRQEGFASGLQEALSILTEDADHNVVPDPAIQPPFNSLGVQCGHCSGSVYMETCRMSRPTDHDDVIASECQQCGARRVIVCHECPPLRSGATAK